jgi:hypothetical protein
MLDPASDRFPDRLPAWQVPRAQPVHLPPLHRGQQFCLRGVCCPEFFFLRLTAFDAVCKVRPLQNFTSVALAEDAQTRPPEDWKAEGGIKGRG